MTPPRAPEAGAVPESVDWPRDIYEVLREFRVRQVPYVPDSGHAALIRAVHEDPAMHGIALTTEEEGIALAAGAWLGGDRCVLLMQSSGVGNCLNMLSLVQVCRFPLLTLVTMRGEWGEFNPWQIPMGAASASALELGGVQVLRVERAAEVGDAVRNAAAMAFEGNGRIALLLSQRLIGAKSFLK